MNEKIETNKQNIEKLEKTVKELQNTVKTEFAAIRKELKKRQINYYITNYYASPSSDNRIGNTSSTSQQSSSHSEAALAILNQQ